jgi:hypothetical protein
LSTNLERELDPETTSRASLGAGNWSPTRPTAPARWSSGEGVGTAGRKYAPYAVDWRILPDEILFVKDYIRHHLVLFSNNTANTPSLRQVWVNTLGRNVRVAFQTAGVVFIHIPKTAGTSLSKVLYGRNLPHYTAEFIVRTYGDRLASLPSFAVVRHPVDRLVSAYKMALFAGTDIVAYSRYWRSRLGGLQSFEAFVDFVAASHLAGRPLPQELQDQAGFVLDPEGRVMVDRLFALDGRRGLPLELRRWLQIMSPPRLNATRSHPVTVTAALVAKIGEIFPTDFELYEYLIARGGFADARGQRFGND